MARITPVSDEPATTLAADGTTHLPGYRVAGIIYAPDRRTATRRLAEAVSIDVGEITGRVPDDATRARAATPKP